MKRTLQTKVVVSKMEQGRVYYVSVSVTSSDGRVGIATVTLKTSPPGSAQIVVTSNIKTVNENSQLVLFGSIMSPAAQVFDAFYFLYLAVYWL